MLLFDSAMRYPIMKADTAPCGAGDLAAAHSLAGCQRDARDACFAHELGVQAVVAERIVEEPMQEQRMRVLVVEGNVAAQEQIRAALGEYYTLMFASGQAEALATLHATLPDLLVTELDLNDGDGLDLCGQVRGQPRMQRLPIMVLTGRSTIQDKVAGFQAGADDYVVKPFDRRLFHARVRLLCRIKSIEKPA